MEVGLESGGNPAEDQDLSLAVGVPDHKSSAGDLSRRPATGQQDRHYQLSDF